MNGDTGQGDTGQLARMLVRRLLREANLSPIEVSNLLGGRVSSRTIYRWAKGESLPKNGSDIEALASLVQHRLGDTL
jgi:hypothetical protein